MRFFYTIQVAGSPQPGPGPWGGGSWDPLSLMWGWEWGVKISSHFCVISPVRANQLRKEPRFYLSKVEMDLLAHSHPPLKNLTLCFHILNRSLSRLEKEKETQKNFQLSQNKLFPQNVKGPRSEWTHLSCKSIVSTYWFGGVIFWICKISYANPASDLPSFFSVSWTLEV